MSRKEQKQMFSFSSAFKVVINKGNETLSTFQKMNKNINKYKQTD